MASKAEYEAVPDVEAGVLPEPKTNPRELYPQANDDEAKLLGYLDAMIDMPNPTIELPLVSHDEETFSLNPMKTPTMVFVATIAAAFLVMFSTESAFVQAMFPYLACLVGFMGTVPTLINRFAEQYDCLFEKLNHINVDGVIDGILFRVTMYVDKIQDMITKVINPMRPKLEVASKEKSVLHKADKDIDIPDPSDIEDALNGFSDEIQDAMARVKTTLDVHQFIPKLVRTKSNFKYGVIYPLLTVFLAMQLIGVYISSQLYNAAVEDDGSMAEMTSRHLRGTLQVSSVFDNGATSSWFPIWVTIQVYVTALLQLLLAFLLTNARVVTSTVNIPIRRINDNANRALESTGATSVLDNYLTDKMQVVRTKLLELISRMNKIDSLLADLHMKDSLTDSLKKAKESLQVKTDSKGGFSFFGLDFTPKNKKK